MQIIQHIPVWVFALLLGLIALGLMQTRTRHIRMQRMLGLNIGLTIFTLVGVVQQWLPTPWLTLGLLSWAVACAFLTYALSAIAPPSGAAWDSHTRLFTVPGSWLPLTLFMAVFVCKFAVGMSNAMLPGELNNAVSAMAISAWYGLFSGLFNAQAWRILKLKYRPADHQAEAAN